MGRRSTAGSVSLALSLLVLTLAATSCDQSSTRVSTLWTNVPEAAAWVERYNASQRDWQILVEYKEDPAAVLTTPGRKADLVLARGLASSPVMDTLVPLDFLFDGGNLAQASFYRRILDTGRQGDRFKLLPVSFDLPVLVYPSKVVPTLPGFSVNAAELHDAEKALPAPAPGTRRWVFSPQWEDFGLTLALANGADLREGFQGSLAWNQAKLSQTQAEILNWPRPTADQAADFQRKYLSSDPTPALLSGRVIFYPSTLATFLARPWQERRDLEFRFFEAQGRVAAAPSVVWAGIPSSSLTRGAAERFLAWLFKAPTQQMLIKQARADDSRAFGLAGGLSAQVLPNQTALAEAFPETAGRIPAVDQVTFWPPLPLAWPAQSKTIVSPWLGSAQGTEASLRTALDQLRVRSQTN